MEAPDLGAVLGLADAAHDLFAVDETVVVGVSGGPDSVALWRALLDYAPQRNLRVHAAHVDHQLRPDSAADAAFVVQLAAAWAAPVCVETVTLPGNRPGGVEAAARGLRYAALARVAGQVGAASVAVAHTADDQAETVLMNLIRGTGLTGLRGMRPVSPWPLGGTRAPQPALRLVRPFLAVDRAQVLAYLSARGIAARDDVSNRDPRFLRNRVRHEALPVLEELNPRVRAALLHLADSAAEDAALLDELADRAWPELVNVRAEGVALDLAVWARTAPAVQQRVLRRAAGQLLGDGRTFGWAAVVAVRGVLAAGVPARSSLPGGLEAVLEDGILRLCPAPAVAAPRSTEPVAAPVPLVLPGETILPGGWSITAELRAGALGEPEVTDPWTCRLDADVALASLRVRGRRPGDRLAPLGMGGQRRRLQDLFVDARVPRARRADWPLVVAGDEILWVAGLRVAESCRLRSDTRRVVVLKARPPE